MIDERPTQIRSQLDEWPGVDMSKATAAAYAMLDPSNTGMVSERQFIEFINECDLDEIVGSYTGQTGPKDINSRLPQSMMFDPSTLPKDSAVKVGEIKVVAEKSALPGVQIEDHKHKGVRTTPPNFSLPTASSQPTNQPTIKQITTTIRSRCRS
jgi:hypothetical protein